MSLDISVEKPRGKLNQTGTSKFTKKIIKKQNQSLLLQCLGKLRKSLVK